MHDLWQQHTEEVKILEGHVLTVNVCGKDWTVEFQPCTADMLRQSWVANKLNQAAHISPLMPISLKET